MALIKNERAAKVLAARRLLGLPSSASVNLIRKTYRQRARECHPDAHPQGEAAQWEIRMRDLNAAYELLIDYCENYTLSFEREVVEQQCRKQDPFEYWKDQFVE